MSASAVGRPASKALLQVLHGASRIPPPVWFMRQAGRYLPEYRSLRAEAGSFLGLVFDPDRAAEVTLQPVRRFGLDAAILFSDILVVPHALGQDLAFVEGEGPRLAPVRSAADMARLSDVPLHDVLGPIYETVARVRSRLPAETALIGFAGAPWTVATYMVEGRGSKDQRAAKLWAYRQPASFQRLLDLLVEGTERYLLQQIDAGAEVIQLFDTWAGGLDEELFERCVIGPTGRIVDRLKRAHPKLPIIGFPRGAGALYERYVLATGVDGVSLDSGVPLDWARARLAPHCVLQGNLDPLALVAGGETMRDAVARIRRQLAGTRHVFNLGHGIVPETPPSHVEELIRYVRAQG